MGWMILGKAEAGVCTRGPQPVERPARLWFRGPRRLATTGRVCGSELPTSCEVRAAPSQTPLPAGALRPPGASSRDSLRPGEPGTPFCSGIADPVRYRLKAQSQQLDARVIPRPILPSYSGPCAAASPLSPSQCRSLPQPGFSLQHIFKGLFKGRPGGTSSLTLNNRKHRSMFITRERGFGCACRGRPLCRCSRMP